MHRASTSLKDYIAPFRNRIVGGGLLVLFNVALGVAIPFILRFAIDELVSAEMSPSKLLRYAVLYLFVTACSGTLALLMRRVILKTSLLVEYDLRKVLFEHLTRLDRTFYRTTRTGDIMTRMTSDLNSVRELVGQGLLQGLRTVLVFTLAFTVMFMVDTRMALVMLLLLPAISVVFFVFLRLIRFRYEASQEQLSSITAFSQESFDGIRSVKGFGLEERKADWFRDLNHEYIRRQLSLSKVDRPVWPLMLLLFSIGVVLLLVVGGRQVITGETTLGEFVQFNQYLFYLQWPMLALGWTANLVQRGLSSWQRICEVLKAEPVIRDGEPTDPVLQVLSGDIVFRNVTLRLDGRTVLHEINLKIPEGATVALTGPTGSGKTQLVSLLARLVDPTLGELHIGQHDIREYPLDVLRRHIGFAPQEPFLFSDTLANNLAFGLSEPFDERVLWAANVAQLQDDVDQFPGGYQTMLGERGITLSGGQRQRTAIGRAVARNPSILILDDVFSAIDTQTESSILEQLQSVISGRTSVIISHRVSTLRHADFIVVLEQGRVTQQGPHDQLVRQPGYYRELDEMQRLEARLEATS